MSENGRNLPATKQALLAPFQSAEVRIKNVPAKPGKTAPPPLPYVSARVVMNRLDEVLPFSWSFTLGPSRIDGGNLTQYGTLTLHVDGRELRYEDVGIAPPDGGAAQAKQAKQAVSDCLKRCAIHAGVGRYLYEMQGVRANGILQPSLEKAVRAVGWTGTIEKHHWGTIGGVRELDAEDEDAEAGPSPAVVIETPAEQSKGNTQALANGHGEQRSSSQAVVLGLEAERKRFRQVGRLMGITNTQEAVDLLAELGIDTYPATAEEYQEAAVAFEERRLAVEQKRKETETDFSLPSDADTETGEIVEAGPTTRDQLLISIAKLEEAQKARNPDFLPTGCRLAKGMPKDFAKATDAQLATYREALVDLLKPPAVDMRANYDAAYAAAVERDGPAKTLLPPTEGIDPRAAQQAMSVSAIKG